MSVWARLKRAKIRAWVLNPETPYKAVRAFVCSFDGGLYFFLKGMRFSCTQKGGWRYFRLGLGKLFSISNPSTKVLGIERPDFDNSVAIIVTFSPDAEVIRNLGLHAMNFGQLIIVDNSPDDPPIEFSALASDQVTLIRNKNRFGLAGALNIGIREASNRVANAWIFFFDQDTKINTQFQVQINECLKTETSAEMLRTLYGIEHDLKRLKGAHPADSPLQIVNSVITSGSFLRRESLLRLGPYIRELFIDSLDHEYCLRAKRNGYQVKRINLPLMEHHLGSSIPTQALGVFKGATDNHAPFRWYFFTRNLIFVGLEGLPSSLPWVLGHGFGLFKYMIKVILFEKGALRKLQFAILGLKDGLLGKLNLS